MLDLYIFIDLKLGHSQSNYHRKSKARNVNWERARKALYNKVPKNTIDDE